VKREPPSLFDCICGRKEKHAHCRMADEEDNDRLQARNKRKMQNLKENKRQEEEVVAGSGLCGHLATVLE
jgi:hypothetical protein